MVNYQSVKDLSFACLKSWDRHLCTHLLTQDSTASNLRWILLEHFGHRPDFEGESTGCEILHQLVDRHGLSRYNPIPATVFHRTRNS